MPAPIRLWTLNTEAHARCMSARICVVNISEPKFQPKMTKMQMFESKKCSDRNLNLFLKGEEKSVEFWHPGLRDG